MLLSEIYKATLPIVATETLIMGMTLLILYGKKEIKHPYKQGICFLSAAMLMMAFVNYAEFCSPMVRNPIITLSIIIPAAATQLLLLLYTYISFMDSSSITRRRIFTEILLILLFTTPPLCVPIETYPTVFYILFYLSICFYLVKYILSLLYFRKVYLHTQATLKNYYSNAHKNLLDWVDSTFYTVLIIGILALIIPFTNFVMLIAYQVLVFFAYFYIYWESIRHESFFIQFQLTPAKVDTESETLSSSSLLFDKWMAQRYYAYPKVTIDDVAMQLKTNRTTLSLYLNSELKQNFYEWISSIRIEEAKKLLIEQPTLPIVEIANYVGIDDRSNFDKLFKRNVGLSPAAYRIQQGRNALTQTTP